MVSIPTRKAQREYFEKHKEEILNSGHRFAVISDEIKYYDDRKSLYKDFPKLHPDAPITSGTPSSLIDIGELTNSLEYRLEKNEKGMKECNSMLKMFKEKKYGLEKEAKELKKEEKLLRKKVS